MAVVTPLNNFLGPEGDTVTVDEQLLNTQYSPTQTPILPCFALPACTVETRRGVCDPVACHP